MTTETSALQDVLANFDALAADAKGALAELDEQRTTMVAEHHERLAVLDDQRAKLRRVLKALGEEEPKRPTKSRKTSAQKLETVVNAILGQKETFTAIGIHELIAADWTHPHTYVMFTNLQEQGFIAQDGKEPGSKRTRFRIANREIGEQLLRAARRPEAT